MLNESISAFAGLITSYAFSSSIKSDQKRLEKEIKKLSEDKQKELLSKVQQLQSESERQKIVFEYLNQAKIIDLKNESKTKKYIPYLVVGVLFVGFLAFIIKNKK